MRHMKNQTKDIPSAKLPSFSQEEALSLILNNLEDTFLLIDKDLRIITTNEHTRSRIFQTLGSMVHPGLSVLVMAPPERHNDLKALYADVFNGTIRKSETEFMRDGKKYIFENLFKPAYDNRGEIVGAIVTSRDITETRNSEIFFKEMEERWLFALEGAKQGIWDWNIPKNEYHISESCKKLYGYEDDELSSNLTELFDLIHPDDRERVVKTLDDYASGKNPGYENTFRIRTRDGSFKWILSRGKIISRTSEGAAHRMIGIHTDISEQIRVAEDLRVSNDRYRQSEQILSLERLIFEMSANLDLPFSKIVESLLEGLEKIHSEAYTSVLLLKDDEQIECLASPRLPQEFTENVKHVRIGPAAGSCGTAMYLKQAVIVEDIETDPLWASCKNAVIPHGFKACWSLPIIHSSGKVMGSFAIYYKQKRSPGYDELNTMERIRNILRVLMEHNWSLNEIKVAHERFDIMMQATHDLIWDWDLEKNIIYRNQIGLAKVFGMDNNEAIRGIYQWLGRVHPDDQNKAEDMINEISTSKDVDYFELEYRFRRDDGSYSHVYDRGKIIRNLEGQAIRIIGAAQDLTERKRLEQELLQNELERQKAINQATVDTQEQERSEIGKELHDNVNQVLTTTKLYLDLALTNAELKDELIGKSNHNIVSVINEIRQLSRSLMDPSIGDLGLIDSLYDLIESINLTRKLQVTLTAEKKLEDLLNKNQKLTVFRIIQEALNNAIKHAKATSVTISFKSHKKHFGITIQDNGIGFEPMFVKKGAGLKNIQNRIYLINGTHSLHSAPGKGCKISINFPLTTKKSIKK
jgi:PAS domain S-box-containing protein